MTESNRIIITGMQLLLEDEWVQGYAVIIEGGIIKNVMLADGIKAFLPAKLYEFPEDYYLIPGLIDLHIHGANGHDVMDGTAKALTEISHALAAEGVTGFLATTMTAAHDHIGLVLGEIANALSDKKGAAILGAHLEGPFISPDKIGAQKYEAIEIPDIDLITHWQTLAKGAIKLVTLAPELPGALQLIKALNDMGIIVSAGHTNATYAETNHAIKAGCAHATHLFNAMRGIHQREPGAVGALLLSEDINAELIVDGLHLHPAIVEMALRLKGKDKLLLVTDAMRAKCLGEGQYDLGGQMVAVKGNAAMLADGTLAGSTLCMPEAIKNMVQFTQCSLADAIYMASYNPARVLGMENRKGSIANGKEADMVVMNSAFDVVMTMRAGMEIYRRLG